MFKRQIIKTHIGRAFSPFHRSYINIRKIHLAISFTSTSYQILTMLAVSSVFLLIIVSFCYGEPTNDRTCLPDTIDFATKVDKSSVVVYGKAMAKILNDKTDSTFHIFFQVDCILK